mmetsp:Transcript_11309/g.19039  ORF Transcript_11309/g.19039 Transcript_11309/m.19039 type:complete len:117 (-) Transcript_11309:14-364(-)
MYSSQTLETIFVVSQDWQRLLSLLALLNLLIIGAFNCFAESYLRKEYIKAVREAGLKQRDRPSFSGEEQVKVLSLKQIYTNSAQLEVQMATLDSQQAQIEDVLLHNQRIYGRLFEF